MLSIRKGKAEDASLIAQFVRELALYERLAGDVTAKPSDFEHAVSQGHVSVLIAEWDGAPCGFALYFFNFSTFRGRRGVYLEDLFVREAFRGRGMGKALLAELANIAVANDCARLEWAVLDWNTPSIEFYKSLGAKPMNEWAVYRLDGAALEDLAGRR